MNYDVPAKLTSPRVWRTYQGGSRIDAIHGIADGKDSQFPEEWIMSVVNARNAGREHIQDEGLCYLEGTAVTLREYIAADPAAALGNDHVRQTGNTPGVLVKLLDSAERLTIQVHPDKQQARRLFDSAFGKTECWHILECRSIDGQEPCIYLGFREGITREYWQKVFREQDIPAMLNCLHQIPVKPGETYLVQGGVPHAIGPGCLLVEIQEPTDYTIRTERVSPKGLVISDRQCHQGLGFEKMFDCFSYQGCSLKEAYDAWQIPAVVLEDTRAYTRLELVGRNHTPCFGMERFEVRGDCRICTDGRMCGLYILKGSGHIQAAGQRIPVKAGEQFFVPAACASFYMIPAETLTVFRCMGPWILPGE